LGGNPERILDMPEEFDVSDDFSACENILQINLRDVKPL
jgi:hypothetical protein